MSGLPKILPPGKGGRRRRTHRLHFRYVLPSSAPTTRKGSGSAGGQEDKNRNNRRCWSRMKPKHQPRGLHRSPARATATNAQPCDSADPGAQARPALRPQTPHRGPAGRRGPGPAGPRSPARRERGSLRGPLTIFSSLRKQPLQPGSVRPPRRSLPFPGLLPSSPSAGSASVRARKEGGRGSPGGTRAGPGLPRPQSRGAGPQSAGGGGCGCGEGGRDAACPGGKPGLRSGVTNTRVRAADAERCAREDAASYLRRDLSDR